MNTENKGGQTLRKRFAVTTNDPGRSQVQLMLTGKVTAYVNVEPSYVRLRGHQGEKLTATVRIQPEKAYPFTITEVKPGSGHDIHVDWKPLGKNPVKDGYQLLVTAIKPDLGAFRDIIVVETDLKEKPMIRIPVSGRIQAQTLDRKEKPATK